MHNGRQEQYNGEYGLAYGRDHAFGLFVQVWKLDYGNTQPDDENIIIDLDQFQKRSLSVEEIVGIAEQYGFDLSAELVESF